MKIYDPSGSHDKLIGQIYDPRGFSTNYWGWIYDLQMILDPNPWDQISDPLCGIRTHVWLQHCNWQSAIPSRYFDCSLFLRRTAVVNIHHALNGTGNEHFRFQSGKRHHVQITPRWGQFEHTVTCWRSNAVISNVRSAHSKVRLI